MTRTPEEIYEEIRSLELPRISKGASIAECLKVAEAKVAHYTRIESLWDEICKVVLSDHDVPTWVYAGASGASNYALECKLRAEERVDVNRRRLESERVSAGTT